ncbi:VIT1/CCC1 transporter family protein [Naasia lichenicola]|uniref:Rubrerythrin family protein n=1 Tax=Naasia lichenicola TaxID=2565933 RepID=A0A4V6RZ35_9MICO|nr:VIT1/CCC1 family protein [Naasia lichenicola]THG33147.1 rubrerythrin family protein [Naasia lichenicola]
MTSTRPSGAPARARDLRRWRRYLADEREEGFVYRDLASRRSGSEREILLGLADAETRHEQHWRELLGLDLRSEPRVSWRTRALAGLARRFGSVFVLALMQRSESRSPYEADADATDSMAADERIHAEVVRGLAERGRSRISGTFRAAVFGANDGLVSNLALVLGVGATGVAPSAVLFTGIAGLLAGALSMGAGEFVSVRSQRELLAGSRPSAEARQAVASLDVEENELELVYRARGMTAEDAANRAKAVLLGYGELGGEESDVDEHEAIGSSLGAAVSSFIFFASGAIIPVLPYIFGMTGLSAVLVASALVGIALLLTGTVVGLLSGTSLFIRALRQLLIGWGAAAATYLLGLLFGTSLS